VLSFLVLCYLAQDLVRNGNEYHRRTHVGYLRKGKRIDRSSGVF